MEIINSDHPFLLNNETAATIGVFDGVHSGHRFLLEQLKIQANANNLPSMVITFPQYPQNVLQSGIRQESLNTFSERIYHLSQSGIDYCLLLDFTRELSQLSAKEFIQNILKEKWNVRLLLIGYDHRFGKNREEGFNKYLKYGKECGIEIIHALELPDIQASSSQIRNYLLDNKIKEANRMLSYYYPLTGKVIEGNRIGNKFGFPTANLSVDDENKIIPGDGIYAVFVKWNNRKYDGMVYIGKRPTITTHGEKRIEVHLINFSGNLYGETLQLEFVEFLREDRNFGNIEDLRKQLNADRETAVEILRTTSETQFP